MLLFSSFWPTTHWSHFSPGRQAVSQTRQKRERERRKGKKKKKAKGEKQIPQLSEEEHQTNLCCCYDKVLLHGWLGEQEVAAVVAPLNVKASLLAIDVKKEEKEKRKKKRRVKKRKEKEKEKRKRKKKRRVKKRKEREREKKPPDNESAKQEG